MTTPINNFQDVVNAMERDPALRDALRRHILTDDLLQVPAHLDSLEGDIGTLKEGQARLEEKHDRLERKVDQLDHKVDRIDGEVSRLGGDVRRLAGTDYESHVATYVHRYLRRNLGINAAVLPSQCNRSALTSLLDEAESHGLIEPADTDELDKTDRVLTADGPTDYLLAEFSVTVQQDDVDRAAERASLLAKATPRTVTPFAIGTRESQASAGDVARWSSSRNARRSHRLPEPRTAAARTRNPPRRQWNPPGVSGHPSNNP